MSTAHISSEPSYIFPAIRGIQAGREYFSVMCPLRLVPRIFIFDEEELRPELRAQRTLNRARVPEMAQYLVNNPDGYIFSALTASIDGVVGFEPVAAADGHRNIGQLFIPMSARILINDGQHRRAAIEEALRIRPELGHESIAVVFFIDAGLQRSQQMFADLNTHAIRPSMSIGILYDHRDPLADLVRELASSDPLFHNRIELEKTTISNRSIKLFTLSALYQATRDLLGDRDLDDEARSIAARYWKRLGEVIPEWRLVVANRVSPAELRADFVHAHGVALQALGRAGGALINEHPDDWESRLAALEGVDWRRTNCGLWEGRALVDGRVSKAHRHVLLTTAAMKRALGLAYQTDEAAAITGVSSLNPAQPNDNGDDSEAEA